MPVKLQLSHAKTSRSPLLFIKLNLYSTKYSFDEVNYSLYFTEYKLGEAVCSRLFRADASNFLPFNI